MGCYPPLGKIVSKALGKCYGRERWREERMDYAMAYPPGPPMETHCMRPVARTVTFASTNSVYVIPPEPTPPLPQSSPPPPPEHHHQQPQTPPQHEPDHHPDPPQPQAQPQPEPPAQTQDAPPAEPKPPKGPKRGKNKQLSRVRFGSEPPPPQQQQQHGPSEDNRGDAAGQGLHGHGPHGAGPAQGQGHLFRYTPSPLPRWEATPKRHEYFSGEYRSYYPTPVREGIYSIATDANRLTTIFSEENPNACTIV
ncbi:formin-like protein 20 [Phragmites australis]|uniref:formin-like protein 20 n=1 Tax=Phragmites australis TaxID=29695 RepID=UPI002D7A3FE7|nr:formin-like protein 20 [Phragmites australis]